MLKRSALFVKEKANSVYNELKKIDLSIQEKDLLYEQLRELKLRIGDWEKSTFGELQIFYEVAYLKIVEARLLRKFDLIKSIVKIFKFSNFYRIYYYD